MGPPQMELAYSRLLSFDIGRAQSSASDDPQQEEEAPGSAPPHGYDVLVSLSRREASPLLCYMVCAGLGPRPLPGIPVPVLTPASLVASAQVRVICAKNLLGNDWWNGLSDPYVLVTLSSPGGGAPIQYK